MESEVTLLELFASFKELFSFHHLYLKSSNYSANIASEYVNCALESRYAKGFEWDIFQTDDFVKSQVEIHLFKKVHHSKTQLDAAVEEMTEWQKDIITQLSKIQDLFFALEAKTKLQYTEIIRYSEEIVGSQTKDFNMKLAILNNLYRIACEEKRDTALIYLSALSLSPFLESDKIHHYELYLNRLSIFV
jgi:hypothetical protein